MLTDTKTPKTKAVVPLATHTLYTTTFREALLVLTKPPTYVRRHLQSLHRWDLNPTTPERGEAKGGGEQQKPFAIVSRGVTSMSDGHLNRMCVPTTKPKNGLALLCWTRRVLATNHHLATNHPSGQG